MEVALLKRAARNVLGQMIVNSLTEDVGLFDGVVRATVAHVISAAVVTYVVDYAIPSPEFERRVWTSLLSIAILSAIVVQRRRRSAAIAAGSATGE